MAYLECKDRYEEICKEKFESIEKKQDKMLEILTGNGKDGMTVRIAKMEQIIKALCIVVSSVSIATIIYFVKVIINSFQS